MNDFVVFDGRLYVKQRYISDQGWMKDSGLSKALKRKGIERLAPSDLGLSGAGGAGAGRFLLATDAIGMRLPQVCTPTPTPKQWCQWGSRCKFVQTRDWW